MSPREECFATAAKGVEDVLAGELRALELEPRTADRGGVSFRGGREACYRANLWLRTANRVLVPVAKFECGSEEALYREVRRLPWHGWIPPDRTLAVDANVRDSFSTHSGFVALKTKDAIVDAVREAVGRRPSVQADDPDVSVNVHLARNVCTVSLDSSGAGLHRRGYRVAATEAPLRETLAAALIELTGWSGDAPLVDPMCGSGTIAIESALKATRRAPGLRRRFGFERWPDFDAALWHRVRGEAESQVRRAPAEIRASDLSGAAVEIARANAGRAQVSDAIRFETADVRALAPPSPPGVILFNPPYGERLGEADSLKSLYREIGDLLKRRCKGFTAWIFTGNPELAKSVGLHASRRIELFNGPIECRLLKYELY